MMLIVCGLLSLQAVFLLGQVFVPSYPFRDAMVNIIEPIAIAKPLVKVLSAENHPSACKVQQERWTGTGTLNGFDYNEKGVFGAVISTNAHVAPTVGDTMQVIFMLPSGVARSYTATAKTVVYSKTKPIDFAFLHCPEITPDLGLIPVSISPYQISGTQFETTGSPSGVWPLRTVDVTFQRWLAELVPGFKPNAIGGQSGSSIRRRLGPDEKPPKPYSTDWGFDPDWVDDVRLTWSWSGLMAGQDSKMIHDVLMATSADARSEVMDKLPPRPEGLIEVSTWQDRGLKDGYFTVTVEANGEKTWNPQALQIWYRPDDSGPIDPPPAEGLTAEETAAALNLKAAGFSVVRVAEFHIGLLQKKTLTLSDAIPDASMLDLQPFVDPNPTRVGSPTVAGWTPPPLGPGELYNEGQIHNGRILTKVCDGDTCHHEWQLIGK